MVLLRTMTGSGDETICKSGQCTRIRSGPNKKTMILVTNTQQLGECRTLWGKCEQAIHCGIELLCFRSQHTGCAWHIAKMRFVTLLSTKKVNSSEKIVMLAEKSLSWSSTM